MRSGLALCAFIVALWFALAAFASAIAQGIAPHWTTSPPSRSTWVSAGQITVIDGDTVRVSGQSIRLLGIDTPETRGARCLEEWFRGKAAAAHLRVLLDASGWVRVELRGTGRFGRPLGVLWVFDDLDAGEALMRAGLARPYGGRRKGWCQ